MFPRGNICIFQNFRVANAVLARSLSFKSHQPARSEGLVVLQVFIQYQILTRCVALIHRVPHMVATLLQHEVTDLTGADDGRQLVVGAAGSIRGGTSRGYSMVPQIAGGGKNPAAAKK